MYTGLMHIENFDPYDFSERDIAGVPVYYKNLPWAPCVHIYVVFRAGAFFDPVGKEGLSHFLEHMIFNGSPKLKDKKTINEWSKINALGTWNAWTNNYDTAYHLECLPEKYGEALSGMMDMMFKPFLRPEDVEHERQVITQEAWGRYKNQKFLAYLRETIKNLFGEHPHGRINSALGWPETIAEISQKDLDDWHKQNYVVDNMKVILVGAVQESNLDALKQYIQGIPRNELTSKKRFEVRPPKQNRWVKKAEEIGEIREQVEITIAREMSFIPIENTWGISLFRKFLGDILNEKLRTERSLCYTVKLSANLRWDYSEFVMNIETDEKNVELVEKTFWDTFEEISKGKYLEKFEVVKKLALDQKRSQERMSEDIIYNAVLELSRYDGVIVTLNKELEEMKKITYEDLVKFTKEIFNREYVFTEIILP